VDKISCLYNRRERLLNKAGDKMILQGKVAVVTGGASGIGRAAALKLVQEGIKVVVADFKEEAGLETVSAIREEGGEAVFYAADVTVYDNVEALVHFAADTYGSLDIMFNNAGIGITKPLLKHSPEDFDRCVKVNQYGVYYGILAASRKMKELDVKGVIINTASVFGYLASVGNIGYHASKGAVVMMTKAAALELAPLGIRVVGIAPGFVDTNIIQGANEEIRGYLASLQMGRGLQRPEQIADTVVFLASDRAKAVNGSVLFADDGYASFKSHIQ
jgi:glucose 1-dehydrogenase